ncbi:MAG: hemolysin family protein [Ancrocorticia sp.]|jgi:CBS domain containing-hemolysin-like protein|nr:hemolysin family protein [Ancrocorticia sp.]MCI1932189.1 hemolysin family protein [Ancrocorticia sp.]MCI1963549.1 hemolysin family protein [Ancrocorticia sp.]MCI2002700.1 hemolysin family protein [Ancrocorticia sp.]MCI2012553.1 hemolysin family protein [Ancrocorticia sp.]
MSDLPSAAVVAAAVIFLVFSAVTSAASTAVVRITRTEAADAYANGVKGAERIVKIVSRRPAATVALSAVRFGFSSLFALCVGLLLLRAFDEWWRAALVFLAVLLVLLVLTTIFSPMRLGQDRPVAVLRVTSRWVWAVTVIAGLVVRAREPSQEESEQLQEDQLALMVERVSESEALDDDERELLQSVFDLGTTLVREVMVPRTDMITCRADESLDRLISLFTRSGYSRIPVVGESVDDLLGVVYLKDVIRRVHHRSDADGLTAKDVMRDPVFVPETKIVDDLMREMQADQIHIALVVDEYGGIAGLVTIEDLVEELVGEISDEHDRAEPVVEDLGDGAYRVPAKLPIDDFGDLFHVEFADDDVDTVGGLFAKALGRVPIAGSSTTLDGIELSAERFEGRRRRLATIIARRAPHADNGLDAEDDVEREENDE